MKVLIDTCVVIDFLQKRKPFDKAAYQIFRYAAADTFTGYITAKSATDIYYLMHRHTHSDQISRSRLNSLLSLVGMADTASGDIFHALSSNIRDFEDAVMVETALRSHADCIVTRNIRDYAGAGIPVYTPDEFLEQLASDRL